MSDTAYAMFRRASDGMLCVQIPAGAASIGYALPEADDDEKPLHVVHLSPFLIDIEPVSVTAFCRFMDSIDAAPAELDRLSQSLPIGLHLLIHQASIES